MHTVIAILEAKPGQEAELQQTLINIMKLSRAEKTCLEYRLHQDTNNKAQFILYEVWESKDAHQQQFNKPYIKEFANNAAHLLAKPYQVYFARELNENEAKLFI